MVEMTPKALKDICKQHKLYSTPYLNDKLYLQYKGFSEIKNLDVYTGLRCVWLEGNGIQKIQGLEKCTELRTLYLHENCIEKIENLDTLIHLDSLNLNKNCLKKIENLSMLPNLHSLLVSHNKLCTYEDVEHIKDCKGLQSIDLQQNRIDDVRILELFKQLPDLRVIYLQGNPVLKKIKHYRKTLTAMIPTLRYLDDRPIFPEDRLRAEAFAKGLAEGGVKAAQAAERAEIKRQREEKKAKEERNFQQFEEMLRNARLEREANKAEEEKQKAEEEKQKAEGNLDATSTTSEADGNNATIKMATAIETAQKGEVNPFSGEKVLPTKENELLTKAREQRVNELMNNGAPPPAPSTSTNGIAPPLPPTSKSSGSTAPPLPPPSNVGKVNTESEKNDSDIFDVDDTEDDDYVNSALELNAAAYGVDVDSIRRETGIVRPNGVKTKTKQNVTNTKKVELPVETEVEELD